jgi:TnpA family transposase
VTGSGHLEPEVLAERLMLAIYAYGTNAGIRSVAGGAHGHTEEEIRYVRRRYITCATARQIAVEIAARDTALWGAGSTALASDSTHFHSWDQNLFTEWHSRYGGREVFIYWHVEKKSLAIHSQLINCTASDACHADQQGEAVPARGWRTVRLPAVHPGADPADRWELTAQQYDQMIKYATAIRTRTASTEAILRRFTRNASHSTYTPMLEVGRAHRAGRSPRTGATSRRCSSCACASCNRPWSS